jgi:meromycolic acid enoyl-[acyl-carrier-protein] reductase
VLSASRLLITGVVTRRSIAFEAARRAQLDGAEIVLTGFGRARRLTERAARQLPQPVDVLELDVDSDDDVRSVATELRARWGGLDGLLHAVAFAPADALGGNFMAASRESATTAFQTSAYSLKALAHELTPLLQAGHDGTGGAIVGLDFDAGVAWPAYDWMGVAKASLESVARYLARDLGPLGIRVNLVSAGPIQTLAAGGIPGFEQLAAGWRAMAPLGWDVNDAGPVAEAVCFLLSARARGITAEIVHVDGGYHAIGAPIR